MELRRIDIRIALFTVSVLGMLCGYRLMLLDHAPTVFNGTMEDLSYGWYVPVFSAYVLWKERKELQASLGEPSLLGLLLIVPFAFVGFLGARGSQLRLEIVGFVGMLASLVLAFFGAATARRRPCGWQGPTRRRDRRR